MMQIFGRNVLVLMVLFPSLVGFIMMRHDVKEIDYLSLGDKYKGLIAEFGPGIGTLIDPEWVLTAAHVAEVIKDSVKIGGKQYFIEHKVSHDSADIALVKLGDPVENSQKVQLFTGDDEVGQTVILVGTGYAGSGSQGLAGGVKKDRQMRAAKNVIEMVDQFHNLVMKFDSPKSGKALPLEGISGPGDSGGPALMFVDNVLYIVGVSSFQDFEEGKVEGMYDALEFYPRVSRYHDWITRNMEN